MNRSYDDRRAYGVNGDRNDASREEPRPGVLDDWRDMLAHAQSTEAVLWIAKDFLASWEPREVAQLPERYRPGRMRDVDDITLYGFELVQANLMARADDFALHRMAAFFANAASRLSQIMATAMAHGCEPGDAESH